MNSVELLEKILSSEKMQEYSGVGGISFPFALEDGRTAAFLYVESYRGTAIRADGYFTADSEDCIFVESGWEPDGSEIDILEGIIDGESGTEELTDKNRYLNALDELYADYDCFSPDVFKDREELTSEQRRAAVRYLERIVRFSDPLKRVCYAHYAAKFLDWCTGIYYAVQLLED